LLIDGKPVYPYEDSPVNTGRIVGTTNWVPVNPLPITRQLLERGQQRYQINCMPCHGPDGDGKGITSKYGMIGHGQFP
jgi:mono/diheme cytochrome c family protein